MSTIPSSGWTNRGSYLDLQGNFRATGMPTNYYAALVARKNPKTVAASAATNEGGGKVGIPVTTHGYSAGAAICIEGTVNYNGTWLVDASSSTNKVVIVATYVAETFTGAETIHEAPGPRTNTLSDLTVIAAGNGYTAGGLVLNRNATDFNALSEDDTNDLAYTRIKTLTWTASGGPIPASGNGARYLVLTDDNATVGSRQVVLYFDLGSDQSVSDGQVMTIQNLEIRGQEIV